MFLPLGIQSDDPPGLLEASQTLVLPTEFPEPLGRLIAAVAIAAVVPLTDVKKGRLARVLPGALELAAPAGQAIDEHAGPARA